ncbi:hypothetical protein RHEC894_PE00437 (plasmid) [Rhizobium sp. CIAT894]|nr:hypothetical protein RHEC894_PE00437 [Rhizobium sp. CIAT894]
MSPLSAADAASASSPPAAKASAPQSASKPRNFAKNGAKAVHGIVDRAWKQPHFLRRRAGVHGRTAASAPKR